MRERATARRALRVLPRRGSSSRSAHTQSPQSPHSTHTGFEGSTCSDELGCDASCAAPKHVCMFGMCLCLPGHVGPECMAVFEHCPRGCAGHGACVAGSCRCDDGYAGADCSVRAPAPRPLPLPSPLGHLLIPGPRRRFQLLRRPAGAERASTWAGAHLLTYVRTFALLTTTHPRGQASASFGVGRCARREYDQRWRA